MGLGVGAREKSSQKEKEKESEPGELSKRSFIKGENQLRVAACDMGFGKKIFRIFVVCCVVGQSLLCHLSRMHLEQIHDSARPLLIQLQFLQEIIRIPHGNTTILGLHLIFFCYFAVLSKALTKGTDIFLLLLLVPQLIKLKTLSLI